MTLPTPSKFIQNVLSEELRTDNECDRETLIQLRDHQIAARLEAKRKAYCYCVAEGSQCDVCEMIYSLQDELRGAP